MLPAYNSRATKCIHIAICHKCILIAKHLSLDWIAEITCDSKMHLLHTIIFRYLVVML